MKIIQRAFVLVLLLSILGCSLPGAAVESHPAVSRAEKLPADIAKRGPETDAHPPILHSAGFEEPAPLPAPLNTSGAEDSPFILPDGQTLYFFFTPDVRIPPNQQLLDEVTDVWVSERVGEGWSEPQRVWLQDPGKLALDGAVCIQGDKMWFASAREGYTEVNLFTARWVNGKWTDWQYAGDRLMKEIQAGEVHLYGNQLYFHSARSGGVGNFDIWVTTLEEGRWSDPVNIQAVNTPEMDGYPYLSADGNELWFTRTYRGTPAILRSLKQNGVWGAPEMIVEQFAGEPTLDEAGNLYFVHHYYENNVMIEADLYVAFRK